MVCNSCGNNIDDFLNDEMVCPYCHEDISNLANENTSKDEHYIKGNLQGNVCENIKNNVNLSADNSLSAISFMLMQILFFVPILNLLFLFIFSFKENINKNIKSFARSILAWYALLCTAIISLITAMLILKYPLDLTFWFTKFKEFINNLNF